MTDRAVFERRAGKKVPLGSLGGEPLTALLACGIVNPMGPTLNALVVQGDPTRDVALPVLHLMLNPFAQEVSKVGRARLDLVTDLAIDVEPFFSLPLGSCPTLLLPSSLQDAYGAVRLFGALLQRLDDGRATLARVRRFPGDPWKRVETEVSAVESAGSPARLSQSEATELAALQLTPENEGQELSAFLFAWRGAIRFQADAGTGLDRTAFQFDDFVNLFARLATTLAIPDATPTIDA